MQTGSGYTDTPLEKKLGLNDGMTIRLVHPPDHYFKLFRCTPADLKLSEDPDEYKDFIHLFTKEADELITLLPHLKKEITQTGCIWISWPKKASKVPTTVNGDLIRKWAIQCGLVDAKVCAIDATWSALKLVIPVKDRKKG